ncbi:MAG: hypothetical protein ACR2P1_24500 [Pseudomonadales bacterium]
MGGNKSIVGRFMMVALSLLLLLVVIVAVLLILLLPRYAYLPAVPAPFSVERLQNYPVIHESLNSRLRATAQEEILLSTVDLSADYWNDWKATEAVAVLRSQFTWEGSELPVLSSLRGEMDMAAHELRDPLVFIDDGDGTDGQKYLLYVAAREQAIGMARLQPK